MPTLEPDAAVAARLDGMTSPVALTSGTNLFTGNVRPDTETPAQAVFCLATGGARHFRFMGVASDRRDVTVQVRVRSGANDFAGGLAIARACRDRLHAAALDGYVSCLVREPEPIYLAQNEQGQHEWSLNAELIRIT